MNVKWPKNPVAHVLVAKKKIQLTQKTIPYMYTVYTFNMCTLIGHMAEHGLLFQVAKVTGLEKQKQKISSGKGKTLGNRGI